MPNINHIFGKLLIFCLILLSASCYKLKDYIYTHGDADYKPCNVKKVTVYFESDTTIWNFTYNSLGNPLTAIHNNVYTGNPNYNFFYDTHNRLIEFIEPYTNGYYDQWSRYGYNNKGQIVIDTNYAFGLIVASKPQVSPFHTITFYDYDSKGRIIHTKDDHYSFDDFISSNEKSFIYDANGNLVDGSVYDNKLNSHRTNAVWMFIQKNYSLNNPFPASSATYNQHDLPIICPRTDIIRGGGEKVKIEYFCN